MKRAKDKKKEIICMECKEKIYRNYFEIGGMILCNACLRNKYMKKVEGQEGA